MTKGIDNTELRGKVEEIVRNAAVILAVINSNKKVNVDRYKQFCQEAMLLVKSVPWIKFTPTAHAVLAHSPQLIEQNNAHGLLNFSESGLEANNKYLRQYRINFSRKTSQEDNLTDCINRLWDKSDFRVVKILQRLQCKCCKENGHTIKSCPIYKNLIGSATEWESLLNFLHSDL